MNGHRLHLEVHSGIEAEEFLFWQTIYHGVPRTPRGLVVDQPNQPNEPNAPNAVHPGPAAAGQNLMLSPHVDSDPDDILNRKTFKLLYKMTKSSSVEVIVDRMIDYMRSDAHKKNEIASRCVELAEQFAPSSQWFIQMMKKIFEYAAGLSNQKTSIISRRDTSILIDYPQANGDHSRIIIDVGKICREWQSLIEYASASHSTDWQQCAYQLQAVLGLDTQAVESILPFDVSCEDVEVDKSLSFLNSYVQQSLENRAQPYIPEHHHSEILSISNFRTQEDHESSAHGLRSEAYELPRRLVCPMSHVPSTEFVHAPEPSYSREIPQDSRSNDSRLRLDGVQKKCGKPSYSSPSPSTSNTSPQSTVNRASASQPDKRPSFHEYKKQEKEVSSKKQKACCFSFWRR